MPVSSSSPVHPVLAHLAAVCGGEQAVGHSLVAALAPIPDPPKRRVCAELDHHDLGGRGVRGAGEMPLVHRDRRTSRTRCQADVSQRAGAPTPATALRPWPHRCPATLPLSSPATPTSPDRRSLVTPACDHCPDRPRLPTRPRPPCNRNRRHHPLLTN